MNKALFAAVLVVAAVLAALIFFGGSKRRGSLYSQRTVAVLQSQRESDVGYQAAIDILEQVVASPEAGFVDWLNLARARVLHPNRVADAKAAIDKAREIGGDTAGTAALDYVEGLFYRAKQDHRRAHDLFAAVLQARPDHPEALYQCGYAAELDGKFADARQRYERLIALKQLVRPAAYRLSKAAAALGDDDAVRQAIALFESRDASEKPETTKCELTDLDLARTDRKTVEAPKVRLRWDSTVGITPEKNIRRIVACPENSTGAIELVLIAKTEILVRKRDGSVYETGVKISGEACGVVLDLDNKPGFEVVVADGAGFKALGRTTIGGALRAIPVRFPDLPGGAAPASMCAFDADHDGDVDIVLVTGQADHRLRFLRNNGDGTFEWQTPFSASNQLAGVVARIDGHDFDQANDLDLVLPGDGRGAILCLNLRGDQYRQIRIDALTGRPLLIAEDFDNDGAPDLFGTGGTPGWNLLKNADPRGRPYQVRFLPSQEAGADAPLAHDAVPGDIDNDGDLDVLLATDDGLVVLRNVAGELTAEEPVQNDGGLRSLEVADLAADGSLDVIAIDPAGDLHIFTPSAGGSYPAIVIAPQGIKDNRGAIGTVIQLYADRQYQCLMLKSPLGARFGLGSGGLASFDGIRMRWPQGVRQSVPRPEFEANGPITDRLTCKQLEGLVASCPFLYVKGASGWTFLTDVIGIAPLAEWMPPGATPHLDPEEFVRIPGDALTVADGRVQLAITEELKETTYLDRVELLYVDHDPGAELLIDENITQGAYDELAIQTFQKSVFAAPAKVIAGGADCRAGILAADGVFVHPYADVISQWGGWTRPHTLDIVTAAPASVLVMQGRMAWYDSTVSYALAQNGRKFIPMRVEQVMDDGEPHLLVADAGLPTGMDRTIIVPLGRELPTGSTVRITSQYRNLWDRIRTAPQPSSAQPTHGRAQLLSAELYFHGYSRILGDVARHEQSYDYGDRVLDDRYPKARGFTNPYGDVLPLVTEHDDRLAILVAGDAIALQFAAPAPPPGTERTWFLRISGWAKESSFHNQTGLAIEPLPFRKMSAYPPPRGERSPWREAGEVLTRRVR